jgi:hypothetical protein
MRMIRADRDRPAVEPEGHGVDVDGCHRASSLGDRAPRREQINW